MYAVGRPELTKLGLWSAAVLAGGDEAVLSHRSAAALWRISKARPHGIEVSVPYASCPRRRGIVFHRRTILVRPSVVHEGIPVTDPVQTLIDITIGSSRGEVERAVNEADKYGLLTPDSLRSALRDHPSQSGVARLGLILDRRTFVLSTTELERLFLPVAAAAGMPLPLTQHRLNGFKVDFYWPGLGLVVETDGLRYHRTPAEQAADRRRDQAHTAAGLTQLRFTHDQVKYEPAHVRRILAATRRRLAPPSP